MEPSSNNKKLLQTIVAIVVGGASYFLVQQLFFKAPTYDEAMMKAASEINKSCPIMVDHDTRLDNAVALPDNVFQYNYTLVNMDKANTDIEMLEDYMMPRLVNNVKTNPQMQINRDNKTTMAYYYKDKNGIFLFKVSVTPELYTE